MKRKIISLALMWSQMLSFSHAMTVEDLEGDNKPNNQSMESEDGLNDWEETSKRKREEKGKEKFTDEEEDRPLLKRARLDPTTEETESWNYTTIFPDEVWLHVLSYLDFTNLSKLFYVNKHFNILSHDSYLTRDCLKKGMDKLSVSNRLGRQKIINIIQEYGVVPVAYKALPSVSREERNVKLPLILEIDLNDFYETQAAPTKTEKKLTPGETPSNKITRTLKMTLRKVIERDGLKGVDTIVVYDSLNHIKGGFLKGEFIKGLGIFGKNLILNGMNFSSREYAIKDVGHMQGIRSLTLKNHASSTPPMKAFLNLLPNLEELEIHFKEGISVLVNSSFSELFSNSEPQYRRIPLKNKIKHLRLIGKLSKDTDEMREFNYFSNIFDRIFLNLSTIETIQLFITQKTMIPEETKPSLNDSIGQIPLVLNQKKPEHLKSVYINIEENNKNYLYEAKKTKIFFDEGDKIRLEDSHGKSLSTNKRKFFLMLHNKAQKFKNKILLTQNTELKKYYNDLYNKITLPHFRLIATVVQNTANSTEATFWDIGLARQNN